MLSWPLCDLTSLCCSVPFLKPSEWVPFSTRLKSSVNSLLWQISISLNLFPGVDAALKLLSENIQFPSVFFFFLRNILFICVCVQNACFRGTCKFVWADFSTGLSHPEPLWHQAACSILGEASSPKSCALMYHSSPCTHRKTVGHSWRFRLDLIQVFFQAWLWWQLWEEVRGRRAGSEVWPAGVWWAARDVRG